MRMTIVGLAVLLGACDTTKIDHAECTSYGYQPNTQQYSACRMFVAAERRRRGDANAALGLQMLQPSSSRPSGTTVYNVGNRTYLCSRMGNVVTCD